MEQLNDESGLHLGSEVVDGNPAFLRTMICETLVLVHPSSGDISPRVEAMIASSRNVSLAAGHFWVSLCVGFAEKRAWYAQCKIMC